MKFDRSCTTTSKYCKRKKWCYLTKSFITTASSTPSKKTLWSFAHTLHTEKWCKDVPPLRQEVIPDMKKF